MSISRDWGDKPGFIHTMEDSVSVTRTEEDQFTAVKRLLGWVFPWKKTKWISRIDKPKEIDLKRLVSAYGWEEKAWERGRLGISYSAIKLSGDECTSLKRLKTIELYF